MKRIALVALLVAMLAGCAPDAGSPTSAAGLREAHVPLSNGRTVVCVIYSGAYQGGVSCDWAGAR